MRNLFCHVTDDDDVHDVPHDLHDVMHDRDLRDLYRRFRDLDEPFEMYGKRIPSGVSIEDLIRVLLRKVLELAEPEAVVAQVSHLEPRNRCRTHNIMLLISFLVAILSATQAHTEFATAQVMQTAGACMVCMMCMMCMTCMMCMMC